MRFSDARSSYHPLASSSNLSDRPAHNFALNHTEYFGGMCGVVLKRHNPFRGLMVVVKDVRVERTDRRSSNPTTSKYGNDTDDPLVFSSGIDSSTAIDTTTARGTDERMTLLVQRLSYAPGSGGGFSELWVPYKDVVDVKCVSSSHCTSAVPLVDCSTLRFRTQLPLVAVQGTVDEPRFLPPISTNQTTPHNETRPHHSGSNSRRRLSISSLESEFQSPCDSNRPTTNDAVLSTEGGPLTEDFSVPCHWTQDIRMTAIGDLKVRVIVDGRECRGSLIRLGTECIALIESGIIEPHRILPRHPTPRNQHGSLWGDYTRRTLRCTCSGLASFSPRSCNLVGCAGHRTEERRQVGLPR